MIIRATGTVIALALAAIWSVSLEGQNSPPRSVWEGIYTMDQAKTGEIAYSKACSSCHGEKLEGAGISPPLAGSDFLESWKGSSVGELFDRIQTSMPADRPGSSSRENNAAILAYILKANDFPSGSKELPADAAALKEIRIQAKPTK
jgi:mono/diheme cytochrome c family protein